MELGGDGEAIAEHNKPEKEEKRKNESGIKNVLKNKENWKGIGDRLRKW